MSTQLAEAKDFNGEVQVCRERPQKRLGEVFRQSISSVVTFEGGGEGVRGSGLVRGRSKLGGSATACKGKRLWSAGVGETKEGERACVGM